MKVYVLETGCYEEASIHGVYETLEAAMMAWQPESTPDKARRYMGDGKQHPAFTYEWSRDEYGGADFSADWSDAASIVEYEVQA